MPAEISGEDAAWLASLHDLILSRESDNFDTINCWQVGSLTTLEIECVKYLINVHKLPCELSGGMFGDIGIRIFAHPEAPTLPPTHLVTIWEDYIPGVKEASSGSGGCVTDEAWSFFTAITHTPRNLELLALYVLEKPKERNDCIY